MRPDYIIRVSLSKSRVQRPPTEKKSVCVCVCVCVCVVCVCVCVCVDVYHSPTFFQPMFLRTIFYSSVYSTHSIEFQLPVPNCWLLTSQPHHYMYICTCSTVTSHMKTPEQWWTTVFVSRPQTGNDDEKQSYMCVPKQRWKWIVTTTKGSEYQMAYWRLRAAEATNKTW